MSVQRKKVRAKKGGALPQPPGGDVEVVSIWQDAEGGRLTVTRPAPTYDPANDALMLLDLLDQFAYVSEGEFGVDSATAAGEILSEMSRLLYGGEEEPPPSPPGGMVHNQ